MKNDLIIYQTYEDALKDENIDAVILTTPHTTHTEQIIAAANHNKHVFVEKTDDTYKIGCNYVCQGTRR